MTTTSSGSPAVRSARCSRNATNASSAQCRSSITSTVGPGCDLLQEASPCGERLLLLGRFGGRLQAHERSQAVLDPALRLGIGLGDRLIELGRDRGLIVGLQDPGLGLHDLSQRPEADPVPVGQASALPPGDELRELIDVSGELAHEP